MTNVPYETVIQLHGVTCVPYETQWLHGVTCVPYETIIQLHIFPNCYPVVPKLFI